MWTRFYSCERKAWKEYLKMKAMTTTDEKITYRSYTIEPDREYPYSRGRFIFYPTETGIEHNYDLVGEDSYIYCGNCGWSDSVEGAKMEIDDKLA
jgi:hypothetical protein